MISVIVPIYNRENELEKCILSIIRQTYRDLEIILVDDGSTDNSLDICQKYARIDERIKIIHKENDGLVSARKAGLLEAKGDYIGHVDGDDWIEETYFETLMEATESGKIDVVIGGFIIEDEDSTESVRNGVQCGVYNKEKMRTDIYPIMMNINADGHNEIYPSQWGKLFRYNIALEAQMKVRDHLDCDEDTACVYPILLSATSICVIDACHYHYIRRKNSLSTNGTTAKKYYATIKDVYCHLRKEFLQFEDHDILLLQLERLVSSRITSGIRKYYFMDVYQYIFPYEQVNANSRIILYGAGFVGRSFYKQITKNSYSEIVLWVDSNFKKINLHYAEIMSPENILQKEFDYIVVCVENRIIAGSIIENIKLMGIQEQKIIWKEDYGAELEVKFHF